MLVEFQTLVECMYKYHKECDTGFVLSNQLSDLHHRYSVIPSDHNKPKKLREEFRTAETSIDPFLEGRVFHIVIEELLKVGTISHS